MPDTIKTKLDKANINDFTQFVSSLRDANGNGFGEILAGLAEGWQTAIAVAANVAVLANPGKVIAVAATTAGATGPKGQTPSAPAAGGVQVTYDANGIPTLTFAGADAVTVCAVQQIRLPRGLATKLATSL